MQEIEISPGAAFLAAAAVFFLRWEELLALLLAAAAHELGHLAAILLLGQRPTGFRAGPEGFLLTYAGGTGTVGHTAIAASGPLAGLLYAWAASCLGTRMGRDWLCLSAGMSLLLSLFNLLPALPLDGGQILCRLGGAILGEQRCARLTRALQWLVAAALSGAGAVLLLRGNGTALLMAGLVLLRAAWREAQAGS